VDKRKDGSRQAQRIRSVLVPALRQISRCVVERTDRTATTELFRFRGLRASHTDSAQTLGHGDSGVKIAQNPRLRPKKPPQSATPQTIAAFTLTLSQAARPNFF